MNSNTSQVFLTSSMEQPLTPSNSMEELPVRNTVSPSEPSIVLHRPLNTLVTGVTSLNLDSPLSAHRSPVMRETTAASTSSSLRSHAKPQEIQESLLVEPRILRVSKEDLEALCQVIEEFKSTLYTIDLYFLIALNLINGRAWNTLGSYWILIRYKKRPRIV